MNNVVERRMCCKFRIFVSDAYKMENMKQVGSTSNMPDIFRT
jgi:hypothetical protein